MTLSAKHNANFIKQQNDGFKRSVYWNEYKSSVSRYAPDLVNYQTISLDPSFQGVNGLFVLVFSDVIAQANRATRAGHRKYFVPGIDIKDYNVIIDVVIFMIAQFPVK